mgnify:CR=1 FL=1
MSNTFKEPFSPQLCKLSDQGAPASIPYQSDTWLGDEHRTKFVGRTFKTVLWCAVGMAIACIELEPDDSVLMTKLGVRGTQNDPGEQCNRPTC